MSNANARLCDEEARLFIEMIDEESSFEEPAYSHYVPSADDYEWGLVKSAKRKVEPDQPYLPGEQVDEYPVDEADIQIATATSSCHEKNLGTIAQYPEFKFKGFKCYRRTRKIIGWARVCYPTDLEDKVEAALKECIVIALIACAPLVLTGALPAAYALFKTTLSLCLKKKGLDLVDKVSVRLSTREVKTRWKRC